MIDAVGDNQVDENGNYVDPLYGKLGFGNLLTGKAYSGDTVILHVRREGQAANSVSQARTSLGRRLRHPAL